MFCRQKDIRDERRNAMLVVAALLVTYDWIQARLTPPTPQLLLFVVNYLSKIEHLIIQRLSVFLLLHSSPRMPWRLFVSMNWDKPGKHFSSNRDQVFNYTSFYNVGCCCAASDDWIQARLTPPTPQLLLFLACQLP
jgi:hypothetical protein